MNVLALAILLGAANAAAPSDSPAVLVDKVVAFVQGRPITLSEVELEVRLGRAAAGDAAGALAAIDGTDSAAMLEELVDRVAALRTLKGRAREPIPPEAVDAEVDRLRRAFGAEEAWRRFLARIDLSEDEVRERRRRRLEAAWLVDVQAASRVRVDRREVDELLANSPEFPDRAAAEARLAEEHARRARREVLEKARADAGVRIVDPLRPAGELGGR